MATKATPEFYIQVPVTAKVLKDLIQDSLYEITESLAYEDREIRKQTDALKQKLFTDKAFRKFISDQYAKEFAAGIKHDLEWGNTEFNKFPAIRKLLKSAEAAEDREFEKHSKKLEEIKINEAIQLLKSNGFQVTEAA